MKLLHGSNLRIERPDLSKCGSRNDFGRGFYLTPQWQRAYRMAKRRVMMDGGMLTVNEYLFYPTKAQEHGLSVKRFNGFSAEWARFVIESRSGVRQGVEYDIIIGPVADTFVDKEITRHRQKYGSRYLETLPLLEFAETVSQFGSDYVQYCFCTERAIEELFYV